MRMHHKGYYGIYFYIRFTFSIFLPLSLFSLQNDCKLEYFNKDKNNGNDKNF